MNTCRDIGSAPPTPLSAPHCLPPTLQPTTSSVVELTQCSTRRPYNISLLTGLKEFKLEWFYRGKIESKSQLVCHYTIVDLESKELCACLHPKMPNDFISVVFLSFYIGLHFWFAAGSWKRRKWIGTRSQTEDGPLFVGISRWTNDWLWSTITSFLA